MTRRTYVNFDVAIHRAEDGYAARVVASPSGEAGPASFVLPFTGDHLELLLLRMRPAPDRGLTRRRADPATAAAQELGSGLFQAVFRGELRDALRVSLGRASEGLRLRIDLTDTPELSRLPWELLFDQQTSRFLALSERTPVVRYLRLPDALAPLRVDPPLRVLAVLSSPPGLPPLDLEGEWRGLREELAPQIEAGAIELSRLEEPTLSGLHRYLRTGTVHVLHFVGHGEYDEATQDGVVYLTDRAGGPVRVWPSQLGPHLFDHDPLRLVVLNACQTGYADREDAHGGMAQGLIQQGVPGVLAMQVPISDQAAIGFARDFYAGIAAGQPVDQALAGARKALMAEHGFEWVTPVLYLRSTDGYLFDLPDPQDTPHRRPSGTPSAAAPTDELTPTRTGSPTSPAESAASEPDGLRTGTAAVGSAPGTVTLTWVAWTGQRREHDARLSWRYDFRLNEQEFSIHWDQRRVTVDDQPPVHVPFASTAVPLQLNLQDHGFIEVTFKPAMWKAGSTMQVGDSTVTFGPASSPHTGLATVSILE